MSELKVRPYTMLPSGQCYDRDEADKVIAELKNEIEEQKRLRNMALASVPNVLKVMKIIQHQKYKRCQDNAWGCQQRMELFHELVLEEARTIALPNEAALKEYRSKRERAAKWHRYWLKIAEQFKEAK